MAASPRTPLTRSHGPRRGGRAGSGALERAERAAGERPREASTPAERRGRRRVADAGRADESRGAPSARAPARGGRRPRPGPGRRLPNLAGLPPLLHGTGAFAALRERLGPPAAPARTPAATPGSPPCRTARRATSPPRSRSWRGERICWVARDSEIGDRVAEELAAWLGDPGGRRGPGAADGARLRAQRARRRRDGGPRGGAGRVAELAGRGSSSRASRRCSSTRSRPDDLPGAAAGARGRGAGRPRARCCASCSSSATRRCLEVAGRGEFARRGGIVDVFPPSAELPVRIEFFGDEIDSLRAFDPTDQRTIGTVERVVLLPARRSSSCRTAARRRCASASGRRRRGSRSGSPPDLERLVGAGEGAGERGAGRRGAADPRRDVGDAAEVWAPLPRARDRRWTTSTRRRSSSSTSRATSARPPSSCGARPTSGARSCSRPASCRRTGRRRSSPPREWKRRLLGVADARADVGIGGGRARSPAAASRPATCSAGASRSSRRDAARRIAEAVERWRRTDGAPGSSSPRTRRRASPRCSRRPACRPASQRARRGAAAGRDRARRSEPQRRVRRRPRRPRVRHRSRAVRQRPRPPARRRCAASCRATSSSGSPPATSSSTSTTASPATSGCCGAAAAGRRARLPRARVPGQDRIFVPVEQIGRISRYSGGEKPGALASSAARDWLRTKARVRKAVARPRRGAARAVRRARRGPGPRVSRATRPGRHEMEAAFPYEETVDQLRAAVEVKHDMEAVRPMDRLVVGDVGYGKTEVAMRAAFKATQDGKQVAVLVPTTVLAAQHFATFGARFGRVPGQGRAAVAVRRRDGAGEGGRGSRRRLGRPRHRHAPPAVAGRPVPGPRAGRGRRGAALRGRARRSGSSSSARGGRPDAVGHADPANAEPGPRRRARHERHRDAAGGPAADPDPRRGGVGRPRARRDPARARPRRPGVLRPQPGRDDRGPGRAAAAAPAGRAARRRARPDGRGPAREGDAHVRGGRGRRPGVHDDHRVRPRHPEREHDRHRPGGHARPRAAVPAPRPRRAGQLAARLRVPALPPPRADERGGAQAAAGDLQRVGAGRRLPDRAVRPRDPRRRQHPRRRAVRPHGRGRVRPVLAAARGGGRGAQGGARESRSRASRRRR